MTDRERVQRVADLDVGQRARQAGQLGVGELLPVADPGGGRHRVLDVATDTGRPGRPVRLVARSRRARRSDSASASLRARVVDRDDRLQVGAPRVEPTAVQHRRDRQRRRARDRRRRRPRRSRRRSASGRRQPPGRRRARPTVRCRAATASSVSVEHRSRYSLVAHRAGRAVLVDDHRDGRLRARPRRRPRRDARSARRARRTGRPASPTRVRRRRSITSTNDFSGTKPSTAGSAAISAPGRFSSKSRRCVGHGDDAGNRHRQLAGGARRATGLLWMKPQLWTTLRNRIVHVHVAGFDVHAQRNGRMCLLMGSILEYDLVVIGSGPGGQKAAIAAAKLGKIGRRHRTRPMLGGVCVNTGTIPSKTLREAVALPDRDEPARALRRQLPGQGEDHPGRPAGPNPARHRQGGRCGAQSADAQPGRSHHRPRPVPSTSTPCWSRTRTRGERTTVSGEYIVIATGTKPARPAGVEFDEHRVLDSDGILDLKSIPTSMVVVGAGRDRHRVRVDVRRAGHQGHRRREARRHAGFLRPRDRRGAAVPPARPGGHVPLRRGGDRASTSARRARSPPWPAASRSPPRR